MVKKLEIPGDQYEQTVKIYENFREAKWREIAVHKLVVPKIVACIGHADNIWYRTTHGRKLALYDHGFVRGSRPLLCVSPDGRQLFLLGGRFKFTERGIVDRDKYDEEIENPAHGTELDGA